MYGTHNNVDLAVKNPYRELVRRGIKDCDAIESEDFEGVEISTPLGQGKL